MKTVEITYEVTKRVCLEFDVTDDEYKGLEEGDMIDRFRKELLANIDDGDEETDWTAYDIEADKMIQDWR